MRRSAYVVLGLCFLSVLLAMFFLSRNKTPIVHAVVMQAVLQKALPDDRAGLERAFEQARARAERTGHPGDYVQALFALSQKLEKVQRLSPQGSEEIRRTLEGFSNESDRRGR